MADSLLTLADLVKINDVSIRDMGATDIFNDAPVLQLLNAITASHGTKHQFVKESTAPTVGFRAAGDGRDLSKSGDTLVTVDLAILDATLAIESALAKSNPKGPDYVREREARRHLRAAFSHGEKQMFYGTSNDAGGFPGLAQSLSALSNAMVLDAGGAGGTGTAALTDVWAIRTTSDERFLNAVVGNGGLIDIGSVYEQLIDGANSKKRNCIVQVIEGWMTLAMESTKSVARLVNLNDTDKTLDDDLLAKLCELFDESNPPTHIIMNKRSRRQLKTSRTATTSTGAAAPTPEDYEGIPIVAAKSIPTYASPIT